MMSTCYIIHDEYSSENMGTVIIMQWIMPGSNPQLVVIFSIEEEYVCFNEPSNLNLHHYAHGLMVEVKDT